MLRLLPVFFSVLTIVIAICPNDTHYDSNFNKCYKYVSQPTTFLNAEGYCNSIGGHLVTVQSAFENSYVSGMARGSENPWIGLNYLFANYWTWVDNKNSSYVNWAPEQPSDPSMYQCASIRTVDNMWTKEFCNSYRPFVCTVDPSWTPVTSSPIPTCPTQRPSYQNCSAGCSSGYACSAGYSLFPGTCKCYKFDGTPRTFANSRAFCQSEGGMLVKIESADLNAFLVTLAGSSINQPWIGVQCSTLDASSCFWQDGTPLVGYSNWASSQPYFGSMTYIELFGTLIGQWVGWNNVATGTSVLCQKPSYPVSVLLEEMKKEQSAEIRTPFGLRK